MEVIAARRGFWRTVRESLAGGHRDYTEGSIGAAILMLAIPMVLELCSSRCSPSSTCSSSSRLGADAVATVALTESMLVLIYAVAMGLSIGATAIVARRIGEKDGDGAARAAVQAIVLGVLIAVPIGLFGVVSAPALLRLMGASPGVVANASFAAIMLGGNGVIMLLFLINAVFRGAGDAAIAMRVLWIANAINICPRSVPDLRPRSVSRARRHRRRGGDDDRPRHRRARAAVRAGAAPRPGDASGASTSGWIRR